MDNFRLSYKLWERLMTLSAVVMILVSLYMKLMHDSMFKSAFQSHYRAFEMGAFIRAMSFTTKESVKYELSRTYENIDNSTFHGNHYYQPVMMKQYNDILKEFFNIVVGYTNGEKMTLYFDDLSSLSSNCRHQS